MTILKRSVFVFILLQLFFGCAAAKQKKWQEVKKYYEKGKENLAAGKLDEAEAGFTHGIQVDPSYATLYHYRGKVYDRKGLLDDAIKEYEKAQSLFSYDAEIGYDLAVAYDKKGRLDDALKLSFISLANANESKSVLYQTKNYSLLGRVYFKKAQYRMAEEMFQKELAREPLSSTSYYYKAKILQQKGKADSALQEYHRAVGLFYLLDEESTENKEYFAQVYKDYAAALTEKGLTSQAEEQMKKYKELAP